MIVDWLFGESRAEKFDPIHPKDPALAALFGGYGQRKAGVIINHDTALSLSGVWCAVTDISQKIAMLPLGLYEYTGNRRTLKTSDPRHILISQKPNRFQNSLEWREMIIGAFLTRGLSVCELITNNRGIVTDIMPLHPDYTEPFKAPDGRIAYLDTYEGSRRVLLSSEVMALRGFSVDGVKPISPIRANALSLGVAAAADEFSGKYFENGTVVSGVLETDAQLSDKAFDRLRLWTERHQGVGRSHNPAILEEGLKWKTATVSAADAQLIESKRYSLADISRIFHFPLYKLAEMTQAKFANVEQQAIDYVGDTLQPPATRLEFALNDALLSQEERQRLYTKINLKGLLRGDSAQRAAFYKEMFAMGAYSPNDILNLEDENPVEHGDIRYVPVNMAPVGTLGKPADEDKPDPTEDPQPQDDEPDEEMPGDRSISMEPFVRDIVQRVVTAECRALAKIIKAGTGEEGLVEFYNQHKQFIQRALNPLGERIANEYYTRSLLSVQESGANEQTIADWESGRVDKDTAFLMQELSHGH